MRIALVGVGGYGAEYARALLYAPAGLDIEFTAGIDPYPEFSPVWADLQQRETPIYSDLDRFYQEQQADLVVIAAPIHLHALLTCLSLDHGAAVLCEKPLAATVEEGLKMLAAEEESGRPVAIGYQWSFSTAIQLLKNDIQAGLLGRPLRLKTLALWPRNRSYYQRNNWAGRLRMPNGDWVLDSPVNNATAHYLHNMLYILGSQRNTSARLGQLQAEVYRANPIQNFDAAALRLFTEDGVEILFYTAHPVPEKIGPVMEYEFENAVVRYRAGQEEEFIARFRDGSLKSYGSPNEGHAEKLWQMVHTLRGGPAPACGIRAALPHTCCVDALRQAPIHSFPTSMLRQQEMDGDQLMWVDGLAQAFQQAFSAGVLPAELKTVHWAVPASRLDLSGSGLVL